MFSSLSRLWNAADALARSLAGLTHTVDDVNGRLRLSLGLDADDGPRVIDHKPAEAPADDAEAPAKPARNGRAKQTA